MEIRTHLPMYRLNNGHRTQDIIEVGIYIVNTAKNKGKVGYIPSFTWDMLVPKYWLTWFLVGVLWLFVYLPRPFASFVGAHLGDLYYHLNRKRRAVAYTNISLCFPELSDKARESQVREAFRVYGQCLMDTGLVWWARPAVLDHYIKIDGLAHYQVALDAGKQVILLTGHFSALDIAGPAISRHYPQIGLINPIRNPVANYFFARGRMRFNGRVFSRKQGLRPVIRSLREGYGFYYLPDEDFGPERSMFVPFLGTEAATITTLPRLARLADAAVLPVSVWRRSSREGYCIKIHPALEDFPGADTHADAARMNAVLGEMVREHPEQYMWTFKFFKTRPGGAPNPYH